MFCKSVLILFSNFFFYLIIQLVFVNDNKSILLDGLKTKVFDKNSFASDEILSNYNDDISRMPLFTSAYIFYTVAPLNGKNPVNKKWAITPIDQTSLDLPLISYSRNPSGAK